MKNSKCRCLVVTLSIGLVMGLAPVQLLASAGDPVDPPSVGFWSGSR